MDPNAMKGSYIGSKIFEAKDVSKRFGDKVILKDWNYTFARYDKIGIVGENGVGKSTFIKLLLGEMQPDSGHFDIGQTVKWGYYSQEGMVDFDEKKKVIDAVREIAEEVYLDEKTRLSASQFLNHFLFSVADQQKYIYKLSGGERRRLNLAVVLMRNPNFLIFDEPTNDLDLVTLTILEDYIANFKGCVIVVSHDRFFLDRIAQHLFVFKGDGVIEDFPGNYSTYREVQRLREEQEKEQRREREEQEKRRQNGNAAPATTANSWRAPREKKGLSFKEKCEKEQLEIDLEKYESEKHDLEQRMSSGEMPTDALVAAGQRMAELVDAIDTAEMRLLELMEIAGE
jgi:ATP-binding cassette subfamily F protein uup